MLSGQFNRSVAPISVTVIGLSLAHYLVREKLALLNNRFPRGHLLPHHDTTRRRSVSNRNCSSIMNYLFFLNALCGKSIDRESSRISTMNLERTPFKEKSIFKTMVSRQPILTQRYRTSKWLHRARCAWLCSIYYIFTQSEGQFFCSSALTSTTSSTTSFS